MNADLGHLAAAAVIVSMMAVIGFNQPSWCRTYTTEFKYRSAMVLHTMAYVAVLLVLAIGLRRGGLGAGDATSIALLATVLLRAAPPVSERLRAWAHRMAGSPDTGRRFARALADAQTDQSPAALEETTAFLLSRGIDLRHDWVKPLQPVRELLGKTTLAFLRLRAWEDDESFASFLAEARNDFDHLRQRFDRLSLRVARALASIERLGEVSLLASRSAPAQEGAEQRMDALLRRLLDDTVSDLCEDLARFHHDVCLLAARGVLSTQPTKQRRALAVQRLGFLEVHAEPPDGYTLLLLQIALFVYGGCWLFLQLVPTPPRSVGHATLLVMYTLISTVSFLVAIVPKTHWGFANSGLLGKTPVPFVIGAGLCALLVAVLLTAGVGALFNRGWPGAARLLQENAIYLPTASFATASTMAWLVQDHRWGRIEPPDRRRWLDAAALAGVWVAGTLLSRMLLDSSAVTGWLDIRHEPLLHPRTLYTLALSAAMGAAIGWFGVSRVRRPRRQVVLTTEPEAVAVLAREVRRAARDTEDTWSGLQFDPKTVRG